jgi:hypothetical protein
MLNYIDFNYLKVHSNDKYHVFFIKNNIDIRTRLYVSQLILHVLKFLN